MTQTPKADDSAKATVVKPKSIAGLFKQYATTGNFKSKEAIANKICATFEKLGQTKNVRGREITKDKVLAQINRIVYAISKDTEISDWGTFTVVEDETQFKLVPKATA